MNYASKQHDKIEKYLEEYLKNNFNATLYRYMSYIYYTFAQKSGEVMMRRT